MTKADIGRLAKAMQALGETFNEPVSEVRAEAYLFALQEFPIGDVEAAVRHAIKHCKFFPRPAELRDVLEGDTQGAAMLGWGEVIGEIRRVGGWGQPTLSTATAETVTALWGSWTHLCATLPAEGPELIGWMKQFERAYAAKRTQAQRPELVGRDEAKQLLETVTKKRAQLSAVKSA